MHKIAGSRWELSLTFRKVLAQNVIPSGWRRPKVGYYPLSYTLYVNAECNYSCTFCYLRKGRQDCDKMSVADFLAIVAHPFNRLAYRVTLGGGAVSQ